MTNFVMRADGVAAANDLSRTSTRRIPLRRKDAAKYVQDEHGQPCSPKRLSGKKLNPSEIIYDSREVA